METDLLHCIHCPTPLGWAVLLMLVFSAFLAGSLWVARSRNALVHGLGIGLVLLALYFVLANAYFLVRDGIVFPGMEANPFGERQVALERLVVVGWLVVLAGSFVIPWLRRRFVKRS